MKSNQKLSILFWLKKSKATKDGKAPIYARITIEGDEEEISTGRKAHPDFWDVASKRVTEPGSHSKATNLKIAQTEIDLERHFSILRSQYERVTSLMLKNAYWGNAPANKKTDAIDREQKSLTLLGAFSDFIALFEKQVSKGMRSNETLKHWRTTKSKIAAFLLFQYATPDINVADIKPVFADRLYEYLTLYMESPLSEITAKMHVKKTKQILRGCIKRELIQANPIQDFVCGGGDNEVEPLEMGQVQSIYRKKLTIHRLIEVRDAFIFQCFTGFAYQDVYGLTKDNITIVGNKGERWLIKDRGKTGVSEMVPILPIVEEIIEKYENHPVCRQKGCLLPINSNARYNGYLKELATICGISRELNTHLARHTFADMMLNSGVPLEDVSKMLGHKNIRTTQRYCKVRKPRISLNMIKAKAVLFHKDGSLKKVS